ncbi:hypothetical protein C2E20_8655 [Micractinium conductrix]|uniref:Uncharacterized protein n=1 Tax=Micractinium conductrix TaxID=554055 RepID=A0A2P6V0S1_9CHLO|nr:hypothetical protein C2E20_8655 [Micractinium conductrix]|eukprot:PSC67690.1 hypothetical protein C2E20_8655 [Micractinium conductrix]
MARPQQAAWDAYLDLVTLIWASGEACVCDGGLLEHGGGYGSRHSRYCALEPVLAHYAHLCGQAPLLAAAAAAAAACLPAWARGMHRVLTLLTEPFAYRVKGVVAGTAAAGAAGDFNAFGVNDILLRSAAVLQQLPALREQHDAAAHAAAAQLLPGQRAEAMAQQLLERRQLAAVGLMLVQLLAYTCTRFDAKTAEEEEEERSSNVSIHASPTHIAQARCAFALQQLPALVQLPLGALAAHAPVLQAGAERRRLRALLLQLCAAVEAAVAALPEQVAAAWAAPCPDQPRLYSLLATLLMASSGSNDIHEAGARSRAFQAQSPREALAAAWELAGPEEQRQLALASLPCANAVCTALAGSHGAALPARSSPAAYSRPVSHQACCQPHHVAHSFKTAPRKPPDVKSAMRDLEYQLLRAAQKGNLEALTQCLAAGADVTVRDLQGSTPLIWAAPSPSCVKALLEAGADPRAAATSGLTALHRAASYRSVADATRALLAAGADPRALDLLSHAPLHKAAGTGDAEVVVMLLDAAPETLTWRDSKGRTPLALALECNRTTNARRLMGRAPRQQHSTAEAAAMLRRLPPADHMRFRTLALVLARMQRRLPEQLHPMVLAGSVRVLWEARQRQQACGP